MAMKLVYLPFVFCVFTCMVVGQQAVYNTSGLHTFTPHVSVIELTVEAVGGGGGGGLVRRSSATKSGGGGGAAYAKGKINVIQGVGHTVYVARGGKKQRGDSDARHGENSWFYSATSADASITVRAEGGQTLLHNDNQDVNGKPGGNAINCIGNSARYSGGHGGSTNSNDYGGGGGGAAGSTGGGNDGSQYNAGSANGGVLLSGHAPGAGGVGGINNGDDDGVQGFNYGGGGGGARKSNSVLTSNRDGSPGAIGIVVISWSRIDNITTVCQGAASAVVSGFNFQTTMPDGITNVTTSSVTLNGIPLTYTVNSNTEITINLPAGATSGNIIVTTTLGRAQFPLTINTNTTSTPPTSISGGGNYCFGNQLTLTANGSALGTGANYHWYTGSCGGTLLATTTVPTYSFTANSSGSTTYFMRAEGTCNTTACASTTVTLPTPNTLGTDGESATCNVNAGETVHFFERTSGNYIASVTAGASSLGSVDATVFVKGTPMYVSACTNPTNPLYMTHTLQRHWIITPTNNNAATVRLPYTTGELATLSPLANGNPNPDDNVGGSGDLQLSKYSGSTINNTPFDNCPVGGTTIHGSAASGSIGYLTAGFTSHLYSQYSIPGFSEFYLHGGPVSTPLSATLSHFSAICENDLSRIKWQTENEQNTSHFIVERSRNGQDWNEISIIHSNGTKNELNNYEVTDDTSQEVYYRLKDVDYDGNVDVLKITHLKCTSQKENKLVVYPNPASDAFTVEINSDERKNGIIRLYDLTGKLIFNQPILIDKGINSIYLNENLRKGVYVLNIRTEGHQFKPTQVIIN